MSVLDHITFRPEFAMHVGVEREYFLAETRQVGECWASFDTAYPHPGAREFLRVMKSRDPGNQWIHELSACQVEFRTTPCHTMQELLGQLRHADAQGENVAREIGLCLMPWEVVPSYAPMPLDVFTDDERYARIAPTLPEDVLRSACSVASTQVHIGCVDIEHAIRVHNALVLHWEWLAKIGDNSNGRRLKLYKQMARDWKPVRYDSVAHFQTVAEEQRFADNPKDCWHLVRISRWGTIELRMFGNGFSPMEICARLVAPVLALIELS